MFKLLKRLDRFHVILLCLLCFLIGIAAAPRDMTRFTNMFIGSATDTPDVTPGDDDLYVKGTAEVDGAIRLDGAIDANSTMNLSGALTASGSITGDGGDNLVGYLRQIVLNSSDHSTSAFTATIAHSGRYYVNDLAGTGMLVNLPCSAAGVLLHFGINTDADGENLVIEPTGTDHIIDVTGTAGDYIYAANSGDTCTVFGIDDSHWVFHTSLGTWTEQ